MSVWFSEALDAVLDDLANGRFHPIVKRVTADMVGHYLAEGWRFQERDENGHVILFWPNEGAPE